MNSSPGRLAYLSALALLLGLAGGGASWVLLRLIGLLSNLALMHRVGWELPSLAHYQPGWWIVPTAMAGGLVVSLLAMWAPVIRGHGIPEAMEAVLVRRSRISPRAALAKPLSAAVAIGTGGPFGAEGPIIVTGGALGSLVGQALRMSAAERKILLASGAAAGMAATFGAPLAAVVLAIELLLFEFSPRAFVPLAVAASVAAGVHAWYAGGGPLFAVPAHGFSGLGELPIFALLGVLCGLLAAVVCKGLFVVEAGYRRLPVSEFWHPIIGGALFALVGLAVPRALGVGYDAITDTLASRLAAGTLAALLVGKLVVWWFALGSGTSGGTLAPILLVGATFGGLFEAAVHQVAPGVSVAPAAIIVVAMAATFGASTRCDVHLDRVRVRADPRLSGHPPADRGGRARRSGVRGVARSAPDDREACAARAPCAAEYTPDVLSATRVADVMSAAGPSSAPSPASVLPEASLLDALVQMLEGHLEQLAAVDADGRHVGDITRTDVMEARAAHVAHEHAEDGWVSQLRRRGRASSQAESRRDPGPGAAPARY